jgi:hypothetical protein
MVAFRTLCGGLELRLVATIAPATFSTSPPDPRGHIRCFEGWN